MRLVFSLVSGSLLLGASAHAQTCIGNDALSSARRARRALDDVAATDLDVDRDVLRSKAAQALSPEPREQWIYASVVGEIDYFGLFSTCTPRGIAAGGLERTRAGFVSGFDRGPLSFRLHWVRSSDALLISDPKDSDPKDEQRASDSVAFSQQTWGGSVTLSRWLRGGIDVVETPSDTRIFASLGAPVLSLSTDALYDPTSGDLDLVRAGATRLRLADTGMLVTVATSYIADERQVTTLGGLTYQGWFGAHGLVPNVPTIAQSDLRTYREGTGFELGGEASGEWRSGRLRHARARAELFASAISGFAPGVWYGPTYLKASIFAETTYFGSQHLRDETGLEDVFGGGGGAQGGFGTRFVSLHLEIYGGANRPEAVARLSEVATRGELRGQIYLRGGW